jgi:hypothetical protein
MMTLTNVSFEELKYEWQKVGSELKDAVPEVRKMNFYPANYISGS